MTARLYDEDRNPIGGGDEILYLDGVKVGDAAIDPESFDTPDHDGSLELPSFGLLDGGISYKLYLKNRNSLNFRFNANNIHPESGEPEWNGVNMDNRVYFGNGFTWNFSISYRF